MNASDRVALTAQLTRLRRDYDAIVQQDFFPGPARHQTRDALEDLTRAANAVLPSASPMQQRAGSGTLTPPSTATALGPPGLGPGPIAWPVRG
jgi:hypothetical protein